MQADDSDDDQPDAGQFDCGGRLLEIGDADRRREHRAHARPDGIHHTQPQHPDDHGVECKRDGVEHENKQRWREPRETFGQAHAGRTGDLEQDCSCQNGPGLGIGRGEHRRIIRSNERGRPEQGLPPVMERARLSRRGGGGSYTAQKVLPYDPSRLHRERKGKWGVKAVPISSRAT